MSIFDRLISTLTGGDNAPASAPVSTKVVEDGEGAQPRRFMGREGATSAKPAPVVEKGFDVDTQIWLHIQPGSQRLLLVPELGSAQGSELNATQMADLQRAGWCEEVAYYAGYDQYWKMPSQEAILRTPSLYQIPAPRMNRIKLETRLVNPGEARGFWMRVRIRSAHELPVEDEQQV